MSEALRIKGGINADQEYWRALQDGAFKISFCGGCGKWLWPAHFRCGDCGSWEIQWKDVEPVGTVYTWTRNFAVSDVIKVRRADTPYVSLLVELSGAAGVRVAGVLKGDETGLRIGATVRGVIEPASERSFGYTTMCWTLTGVAVASDDNGKR